MEGRFYIAKILNNIIFGITILQDVLRIILNLIVFYFKIFMVIHKFF